MTLTNFFYFLGGQFVGAIVGFFCIALVIAGRDSDE